MAMNVGPTQSPEQCLRKDLMELLLKYELMNDETSKCKQLLKESLIKLLQNNQVIEAPKFPINRNGVNQ